jgi:hypothetical protein
MILMHIETLKLEGHIAYLRIGLSMNAYQFYRALKATEMSHGICGSSEFKKFSVKDILNAKNRIINNNKINPYTQSNSVSFFTHILDTLKNERRKIVYIEFY